MLRLAVTLTLAAGAAAGCATAPKPTASEIGNACTMLTEHKSWYKALRRSAKEWGAPMGYQLAVIRQESGFDRHARPPRERMFFGLIPGSRPSDAYGYAQALESTWETYQRDTGRRGDDRNDFRDATYFVGWYFDQTGQKNGLGQYDYRGHYLAYHEGHGGYARGTWKSKGWLRDVADKVSVNASMYERQIKDCPGLRSKFLGVF
jgi:hypothetical protein